jgi:phosphatidylinositol alpha-1,6-mannosyltransferase
MKRRLLSIGHSYCVGLNRRIPQWIARLGADNWDVTVAAPAVFPGDLKRIITAPEPGELPALRTLPAHFASLIQMFTYGRGLRALLKQPWDLIHLWEEPYIFAGGQIAALAPRKTPFVYYTCQNLAKNYPPPFAQIERYCFRRASGWLAMGRTTLETQLARGFTGKPCAVISPGVDTDAFRPNPAARAAIHQRLGWDTAPIPVIGYIGRFVPEKGLPFLMSSLDRLKSPWRALFAGGGLLEPQLQQWSTRHGGNVQIVSGIGHAGMPPYFNAIDMLCVPSQTTSRWREQFGRVIIEAFASGVPVIGSDSGEIPFVIDDAGIVAGERDSAAWTAALELLLDDSLERRRLGDRARDLAVTRHAHPVAARQHLDFFDQILAKRPVAD